MSSWDRTRIEAARASFSGDLRWDEPLASHTFYRIGGPARLLASPQSREDLEWIGEQIRSSGGRFFVLGAGSNVLMPDKGFDGIIIKTNRLNLTLELEESSGVCARVGASVPVSRLLREAATRGWGGLEFLGGIPGTVGGIVWMNAGTHLGESVRALEWVESFDLMTGAWRAYRREEMKFRYRSQEFLTASSVVFEAGLIFKPEEPSRVRAAMDEILARRKATQPVELPSCGSVFKNPPGMHSWQVIDRLGLRGHRIGAAEFSVKHCNFIVNLGGARASDVRALISLAKTRAKAELGIELEEEVKLL